MAIGRDRIGSELLHYRIEALLGRGGMGEVYRAEDLRLKRKVALKLLPPELAEDERFRARFLRESELAASIDHPGIVPVYEAGEVEDQLYLAMRYVEGTDLKKLLREEEALAPHRALTFGHQLADALDAAHERGLVHRDVKPSNILIARHGGSEHCYLADFGLTKQSASQSGVSVTGDVVGTVDYVAPEQIRGDRVDGRVDVYSLGCLLYECLTGDVPFKRASEVATIYAQLEEPPPRATARRPELPPAIDGVLAKAMAKVPEDRFPTCRALVDQAREALLPAPPPAPRRARVKVAGAGVLAAALAAAGALAYLLTRDGGTQPPPPPSPAAAIAIDPASNRIVDRVGIGPAPIAIAVGEGRIWVANAANHIISTIDPGSLELAGSVGVVAGGASIVAAAGSAWVADIHEPYGLWRVDLDLTQVHHVATLPTEASGSGLFVPAMAFGFGSLWVAQRMVRPDVLRVSPSGSVRRLKILPKDCTAVGLAAGERAVWIACLDGRLVRIDPASNRSASITRIGGSRSFLDGLAFGAGAVWTFDVTQNIVWRIDARSGRPVRTIETGGLLSKLAFGEGALWALSAARPEGVFRIDPATNRVAATIELDHPPQAITAGAGRVWVTTEKPGGPPPPPHD